MPRILDTLRSNDLPLLARRNYAAELRQMLLWGVVVGTVEGNLVSVIASKTFGASRLLTTIVWSLPVLMNVLNVGWGIVLRGQARKPAFYVIALGAVLGTASVALTSSAWQPWGGWLFALQIAGAHLFVTGLVTLRTTMWRANYAAPYRARATGRLETLRTLQAALTTAVLSLIYNYNPQAYRWAFPVAALVGLASLVPMRRMRMRGERAELRRFQRRNAPAAAGHERWRARLAAGLRESVGILRTDPLFAKYMLAQFLLGAANFFTDPILINALTKELDFEYFNAQAIMYLTPTAFLLLSIGWWAPYFDRVGVLRFRVINSLMWLLSYVCACTAMVLFARYDTTALVATIPILLLGRVFNGVSHGGGVIAWNIGHLHFAREHQTELYMGIHVGLTGLRALLMPTLGYLAREQFGYGALVVPVVLAAIACGMFHRLARTAAPPRPVP